MTAQEQAFELGRAWEATEEPKKQFVLQIVHPNQKVDTFRIGPHTPTMKTEDVTWSTVCGSTSPRSPAWISCIITTC